MKANEFVKQLGWLKACSVVNHYSGVVEYKSRDGDLLFKFHVNDLKRLVESHEIVAIHGLEKSKEIVANAPSDDHYYSWVLGGSGVHDKTVNIGELRKAIADVESCQ
ncbi:hypothetical protein [Acinetobacter larvae]|uniref:Uncharacterized protein n=1 Tax=Acinetobacter larvae TaxID=1789224 RepID=A0A1B2LZI0_9GAMM|nr:hypothetical protein [Acinetobacter larvae]AOA58309.1 hypothetical protein BFG52_08010 [Acinetobacter larvae]